MRLNTKYKIYSQAGIIPIKFNQRLSKFKRPKWKKIQKLTFKSLQSSPFLTNSFLIKNNFRFWDKIKNYYKDGIKVKNSIYCLYDRSILNRYLIKMLNNSRNTSLRHRLIKSLILPTYRLDILLWKLHMFNSSYQAREAINKNLVYVNDKNIKGNLTLKKGDVVTFKCSFNKIQFDTKETSLLFSKKGLLPTFVEVDYYTGTIVIVKDPLDLDINDIFLLIPNSYNIKKFLDFLSS